MDAALAPAQRRLGRRSGPTSPMIRAYHEATARASSATRSSRRSSATPSNAAAAKAAGFNVITLYPDADGYPDLDALRARSRPRTAGHHDHQPRGHRHLQPGASSEWVDAGARGRRARRLRPGQRQRHPRHHPRPRRRLRRVPVQPAQDLRRAARLRSARAPGRARSPRRWRPSCPGRGSCAGRRALRRCERRRRSRSARSRPFFGVIPNIVRAYAWMHGARRRGPARRRRDRRAEQQLPADECSRSRAPRRPYADGPPPHRAGALLLAGAVRGHRRHIGGDRHPRRRLRHALLDEPPPATSCRSRSRWSRRSRTRRPSSTSTPAVLAEIAGRRARTPSSCARPRTTRPVHHTHHDDLDDPERWAITWRAYRRKYSAPRRRASRARPEREPASRAIGGVRRAAGGQRRRGRAAPRRSAPSRVGAGRPALRRSRRVAGLALEVRSALRRHRRREPVVLTAAGADGRGCGRGAAGLEPAVVVIRPAGMTTAARRPQTRARRRALVEAGRDARALRRRRRHRARRRRRPRRPDDRGARHPGRREDVLAGASRSARAPREALAAAWVRAAVFP